VPELVTEFCAKEMITNDVTVMQCNYINFICHH